MQIFDPAQGHSVDVSNNKNAATVIANAFRAIYEASMLINDVLGANDHLNETVPTNWPLNLSADEFAAECWSMKDHYEALAIND